MIKKIVKMGLLFSMVFVSLRVGLVEAQSQNIKINPFLPQLPPKKEEPPPVPQEPAQNNIHSNYQSQQQFTQQAQNVPIEPPVLKISGLVWNTKRPQAIVNGRVVDVGDKFTVGDQAQDVKIISIAKEGIEVEFMGKNFNMTP